MGATLTVLLANLMKSVENYLQKPSEKKDSKNSERPDKNGMSINLYQQAGTNFRNVKLSSANQSKLVFMQNDI